MLSFVGLLDVVYETVNLKLSVLSCFETPECYVKTPMRQMVEKCKRRLKYGEKLTVCVEVYCHGFNCINEIDIIPIPFIDSVGLVAGFRVNYMKQNNQKWKG